MRVLPVSWKTGFDRSTSFDLLKKISLRSFTSRTYWYQGKDGRVEDEVVHLVCTTLSVSKEYRSNVATGTSPCAQHHVWFSMGTTTPPSMPYLALRIGTPTSTTLSVPQSFSTQICPLTDSPEIEPQEREYLRRS